MSIIIDEVDPSTVDRADAVEHVVPDGDPFPHRLADDRWCPCRPALALVRTGMNWTVARVTHAGPEDRP